MKHKTLATLVVLFASLGGSLAIAQDAASLVRGGRLYDNFALENKGRAPNHPNPVFKTKQVRLSAADSWRCVSCHGWDYKGANGIIGVAAKQKADPASIIAILKDANHPYEELLDETDRADLASFIVSGQMDMPRLLEASRRIKPVAGSTDKVFATVCANCHGIDGDHLRQTQPLGDSARARPFEVLHTIINGHPGGNMPALRTLGEDAVTRMLSSLQTLPSICWVPLALLWFGQTESAMLFVVIMGTLWSVVIATDNGLRNVPPIYARAAQTMGSKRLHTWLKVKLPASLPFIVSGMKQGWAFAWRSLMAAEVYVTVLTGFGLGHLLHYGRELQAMDQVIAIMLVIILIGLLADRVFFSPWEKFLHRRWGTTK